MGVIAEGCIVMSACSLFLCQLSTDGVTEES